MIRSIKTKFIGTVFAILFLMVGVQLFGNYFFAQSFYIRKKSQVIEQAYHKLKDCEGRKNKMVDVMKEYERRYNLEFSLANQEKVCIYNSSQQDFRIWNNNYRVRANFSFKKNFYRFSVKPEPVVLKKKNGNGRVVLFGIIHGQKTNYYVMIKSQLQAVRVTMYESFELLLVCSSVSLMIGGIIAYFFAKKMAVPIQEMDEVAQSVSQVNFSKRVKQRKTKFPDELDRLAENINKMSNKIEENIRLLKQENEYRKQIEERRKAFIANVSHELKTPLSVLTGYAQMLQLAKEGIDKDYYCTVILDETKQMTELVNHLLDLARMEQNVDQAVMEELSLSELVRQEIEKQSVLLQQEQIILEVDIEKECYIQGNEEYLKIIFNNYMSNAIAYSTGEKRIKIQVRKQEDEIILSVYNTGILIPEGVLSKIWDSFYQVEESHTKVGEERHVGLGLYMVQLLAQAQGGICSVQNEKDGVTFFLSIPNSEKGTKIEES